MVHYVNSYYNNTVIRSKLRERTINKFKTNLNFLRLKLFYRIGSWTLLNHRLINGFHSHSFKIETRDSLIFLMEFFSHSIYGKDAGCFLLNVVKMRLEKNKHKPLGYNI